MFGLGSKGIDETILAVGTCMVIIVAAQTRWKSPRVLGPLLRLGQRSYEVYLTHMFVVFAFFNVFVSMEEPMTLVPILFVSTVIVATLLGDAVANLYSEPMNRLLRERWGEAKLGSAIKT
jgi:peptidoglycan/LPS O-acetylase OafA/YrhL